MSSVTVLCPNARRCPIKVTPGMLMRQVLEEACLRNGFDADDYQLSNQKRHVDLALPFRLSGLPNNATLEMVRNERSAPDGKVTIALQLPNGSRMESEFPTLTSLFAMLEFFSLAMGEDLTATSDTSAPSCSYMNRQYSGPVELQRTTLSSIGISSGKCLIRYQRAGLTKEQLNEIAARIAIETAQKEALLTNFAKKKAENEDRERIEADRLARFEEELRIESERKKATASKAIEEPMDVNNQPSQFTVRGSSTRKQRAIVFVPPSKWWLFRPTTLPFSRDVLGSPPRSQTGWSFDAPVFSTAPIPLAEDRLSSLNRLLQQVDTSLNNPHLERDRITDILAERGRVPISQIVIEANRVEEENTTTAVSPVTFAPPCERRAIIFRRRINVESNKAEADISDEFFEVGVDDVKIRQRELREEVRLNTQRALIPTSYIKGKNRERKLAAYRNTVVRIPVGSDRMIQAQFRSAEPISRLFEWVRSIILHKVPFSLKLALSNDIEETDSKNFVDVDLAPKSTIFIKFKDLLPFESLLSEDVVLECSLEEADKMSSEWLFGNSVFKPYTALVEEEERSVKRPGGMVPTSSSEFAPPPHKATAAPRWLKKN